VEEWGEVGDVMESGITMRMRGKAFREGEYAPLEAIRESEDAPLEAIREGEANRVIYFGNDFHFPQRIPATPQWNVRHSKTQ
jgi:hypothetical protein